MDAKVQKTGSIHAQFTYFYEIKTEHHGGAICDKQAKETTVEHCVFEKVETGQFDGGAIYKYGGNLKVSYCCFLLCSSGNKGESSGGNAIYITGTSYTLSVGHTIIARQKRSQVQAMHQFTQHTGI